MIVNEEVSLQTAVDWLEYETGRKISTPGLKNTQIKSMAQELKDWEENPHLYLQDNEGNFVLKRRYTQKKSGRPALKDEAKFAAHRAISRKQKNIKRLSRNLTMLVSL